MSESIWIKSPPKPTPQSKLKELASSSSWVSPFRSQAEDEAAIAKKKPNLHEQFRHENKMEHIKVPAKFAHHPTLEAEAKKSKQAAAAANSNAKAKTAAPAAKKEEAAAAAKSTEKLVKPAEVPAEVPAASKEETSGEEKAKEVEQKLENEAKEKKITDRGEVGEEKPVEKEKEQKKDLLDGKDKSKDSKGPETEAGELKDKKVTSTGEKEAEKAIAKAKQETKEDAAEAKEEITGVQDENEKFLQGDDNIEKQVKESRIEIPAAAETKYQPVESPNKEILEKLKDKPVLLKRYRELNATAIGAIANDVDDPKKVIELGSGLRMTQEQLLDLAAKRVAPVITSINQEVSKTRQEDEIKRQQNLELKVKKHEGKLKEDFDKYSAKVVKKKEAFNQEIERKLTNIKNLTNTSNKTAEDFDKQTKKEIENARKEFADREEKAAAQHETNKSTLEKNHEELLATKKQELEDSKTSQEKTTQEIEELQEKKADLDNKNTELADKIEKTSTALSEKNVKLDELRSQYETHKKAVDSNLASSKELNTKIDKLNGDLDEKKSKHKRLTAEVATLGAAIGAYATKLGDLDSEKKERSQRLTDAKQKKSDWQSHKDALADEAAREHERQRAQATQEYETRKHQEQLERKRQQEEEERLAKEEEQKQAKLKAEEAKKQKEEEKRQAQLKAEEEEKKKQEEAKAKQLEENKKKEASVAVAIKDKEATQKNLEDERSKQDLLYQKGSYKGDEAGYQAAQKNRLREEITNLQKIKDLREERATYTGEDPKSAEIDTLISEREKAIEKLNRKQAEAKKAEAKKAETKASPSVAKTAGGAAAGGAAGITGADFANKKSAEAPAYTETPKSSAKPADTTTGKETSKSAVPEIPTVHKDTAKDYDEKKIASNYVSPEASIPKVEEPKKETKPVNSVIAGDTTDSYDKKKIDKDYSDPNASFGDYKQEEEPKSKHVGGGGGASSVPIGAAAGAATGAAFGSTSKKEPDQNVAGSKYLASNPSTSTSTATAAPLGDTTVRGVNAKDTGSQQQQSASEINPTKSRADDASWEIQSVYEIIPESEFESHKADPDYFEISEEDYDKHKKLEQKVTLFEKL
ncbi:uncharacterized protein LODBEIA_P31570 [Lodderomyces beijingensis]|uniref:Uncharacterized protein n=1 Tax=Lodderomyces beijingensis TaxID=1775926 RepID=A0ABP0ZL95_9ASCO